MILKNLLKSPKCFLNTCGFKEGCFSNICMDLNPLKESQVFTMELIQNIFGSHQSKSQSIIESLVPHKLCPVMWNWQQKPFLKWSSISFEIPLF